MRPKVSPLANGYHAEFDRVDRHEWDSIVNQFADSNIFQTWAYDATRFGENCISHFVLRLDKIIVAAAQARIIRIPALRSGAAYIRWGPLWHLKGELPNQTTLQMAIRALKNEYVSIRRLVLRIFPQLYDDQSNPEVELLLEEGYHRIPEKDPSRTLVLDIRPGLEDLRKQLSQRWRRCLSKAERNNLDVLEGTDDNLFTEFISIYEDMLQRKKFERPNDINEFRIIQSELPARQKMKIYLCGSDSQNSAGAIFSAIGETGVYLFGATNQFGMTNNGSYLIHWKAIQWMKQNGCYFYNLYGINPIKNPGTYVFKQGLAGQGGKDIYYLGRFDNYPGAISALLVYIVDLALPFIKKILSSLRTFSRSNKRTV